MSATDGAGASSPSVLRRWVERRKSWRPELVLLLTAAAVALAIGTRFLLLTDQSLWGDEGVSVAVAQMRVTEIVRFAAEQDTHPPLYYTLLHYWIAAVGDSEFAIRSLSAIFGIVAVPLGFLLARELTTSASTGLAAALFIAVSPIQIEYSQEARMYSLLALTAAASLLSLVLMRRGSRVFLFVYVVATAALLYTHIYGAFVLLAEVLWVLLAWRTRPGFLRRFAIGAAGAALLFLPWSVVIVAQAAEEVEGGQRATLAWLPPPGWEQLRETLVHWWGAPSLAVLGSALAGTLVVRELLGRRSRGSVGGDDAPLLLATLTVLPLALAFVLSHTTPVHVYLYRYTTASAFVFLLFLAVMLSHLDRRLRPFAAAAVFVLLAIGTASYYSHVQKTDVRSATRFVGTRAGEGDIVVIQPSWQWQVVQYYLRGKRGVLMDPDSLTAETLMLAKGRGSRVWLLQTEELTSDPPGQHLSGQLWRRLGQPVDTRFHGVQVRRFG